MLLLASLAVGCGGSSSTTPPDAAPTPTPDAAPPLPDAPPAPSAALVSVAVAPVASLAPGESQALVVTGTFDDGAHSVLSSGLTWETSAPAVATVSAAGVVTAVGGGSASITVTIAGLHAQVEVAVTVRVFGDDYGPGLAYAPFGGSSNTPAVDPAEKHAGTASLRIEVPAAGYTGGAFTSATAVDLSSFTAVSFWARASKAATLNVVGFGNDAASTVIACEWNAVPLTTEWAHYVVPIPDASKLAAAQGLFHVAEGADEGAYTLWLDDVEYVVPAAGVVGPARPAIATETIARLVGGTTAINGAAVTYAVGGSDQTVATARRYFSFHSSDEAIATVDGDGVVTAHAAGTATITAKLGAIDATGALTVEVTP